MQHKQRHNIDFDGRIEVFLSKKFNRSRIPRRMTTVKSSFKISCLIIMNVFFGVHMLLLSISAIHAFVPSVKLFSHIKNQYSKFHVRNAIQRLYHEKGNNDEVESTMTTTTTTPSTTMTMTTTLQRTNVTLEFPSFIKLMNLQPGEYVTSNNFVCISLNNEQHRFCVKLYPRGGGHGKGGSKSLANNNNGFGMAYKITSPFASQQEEKVGMYLQYLGKTKESNSGSNDTNDNDIFDYVDATFALRLKGRQQSRRRFDVEWRGGMRFVSSTAESNLKQGIANDFGAHLMQTQLLQDFLGISNTHLDDPTPVIAEVEVTIHDTVLEEQSQQQNQQQSQSGNPKSFTMSDVNNDFATANGSRNDNRPSLIGRVTKDIRQREDNDFGHNTENVRVGKIVVPILTKLSQRPKMFQQGAYPGVEYRILRILENGEERFTSCPGADYELKPIYPLVSQLERPWPVTVNESDIPRLYTSTMYNVISAFGSLYTAMTGLFAAFLVSQAISLFLIPSKSMDPTLQVGDVLLVDKMSPRILHRQKVGDIILFSPPSQLQEIVAKNGGKLSSRDLFVKRIAASPGDRVSVDADGEVAVNDENVVDGRRDLCEAEPLRLIEKYIQPSKDQIMDDNEVFVMGDCSSVSVDSRVWGPLETKQIVGKPILRLWPLERFGPIQ